jgi:hypothetical protein
VSVGWSSAIGSRGDGGGAALGGSVPTAADSAFANAVAVM